MSYRNFLKVDLVKWVYRTVDKYQHGKSWGDAWPETYREIGGLSESVGLKFCPMKAAKTLYEFGRIKDGGIPFKTAKYRNCGKYPEMEPTPSLPRDCCAKIRA